MKQRICMLCAALLALAFIMPAGLAASIEGESELMDGITSSATRPRDGP